jgi:cation:H+ antiporter
MLLHVSLLFAGFVVLVLGADWLVRGASRLATAVGISPLVVGLTVVAFGTSAPELAVSVMSAFKGQADIALGNVVGSNICNVLLILGISAIIIPLVVHRQLVRLDIPVMVGVSLLMWALSLDGRLGRIDGIVLALLVVGYVIYLIRRSRREEAAVREEYEKEYGSPVEGRPPAAMIFKMLGLLVVGIAGLVLGSKWLVDSAVFIAREFGISELIIGLTIISFGTSLPEIATSIMAALKGERDIAVGNIVGSNTFNILTVLGIASAVSPSGISVPVEALRFDIPFMVMIAVVCWPMLADGLKVSRINGICMLAFYGAYLVYLFFLSTNRDGAGLFYNLWIYAALPAVVLAMIWMGARAWRTRSV